MSIILFSILFAYFSFSTIKIYPTVGVHSLWTTLGWVQSGTSPWWSLAVVIGCLCCCCYCFLLLVCFCRSNAVLFAQCSLVVHSHLFGRYKVSLTMDLGRRIIKRVTVNRRLSHTFCLSVSPSLFIGVQCQYIFFIISLWILFSLIKSGYGFLFYFSFFYLGP